MLTLIWILQIIAAVLLIILVLIHSPKGDGLGAMGGMANIFSSQKSAESGLNKLTANVALVFVVTSLITEYKIVTLPLHVILICALPIIAAFILINFKR